MALVTPRKSLEPFLSDSISYYDHQVEGVRWMAKQRNAIIADEMGTGKSLQALTTFVVDVKRGWARTGLIVCPPVLKENWKEEIEKFTTIPAFILSDGPGERAMQMGAFMLQDGPKILIVNYEQLISELKALNAFRFDIAIFDEAHVVKNAQSKRTQAFIDLWSHRSLVLTGTPMLNGVAELWPLLHKVDPIQFPDYWKFVNRYCVRGGYKNGSITGTKNEEDLMERLGRLMIRRLKSEVLDLPEVNIVKRGVRLYDDAQEIYDAIADEMRLPRPDAPDEDIEHAFVKILRLKQLCGNTISFNGIESSAKMDAAMVDDAELIVNKEKIIVFTQFREVQSIYAERLRKQWPDLPVFELHGGVPVAERVPMIHQWSGVTGAAVIVCMLQVAGVGLNMTASRNVSFLDELFVPGLNQQAIDRVHRIGADVTQPITVRRYICAGTYENRIEQILKTKSTLISGLIETDPEWQRKLLTELHNSTVAA